ncbi:LAMI_0B05666g1_1 [Lachancea mirantina]|uniref:LAMI_0B05666g1_1 n=1 Tax=Lachancea mirantina TaxID=1230905 RepID=A0A1G4IWB5_9SACH|nr:LAMI_0B05666g1_1 [Lachancea mirantina]
MANATSNGQVTMKSLEELPLEVIFRILFFLPFEDLRQVSKTCRMLRVLSNESIMYHRMLRDPSSSCFWTKRLLFDFLHIVNRKTDILGHISAEKVSIIGTLRAIQQRFDLDCSQGLLASNFETSELSLRYPRLEYENMCDGGKRRCPSPQRPIAGASDKQNKAYLAILKGFHKIADRASDLRQEDTQVRPVTPTKTRNVPPAAPSPSTTLDETQPLEFADDSPTSSFHSRSASSLFSEAPKVAESEWPYLYELERVSDENTDSDSSSSNGYIEQLRNSNKVKDKRFIYERLASKDRAGNTISGKRSKHPASNSLQAAFELPEELQKAPNNASKRTVSQGYLIELERLERCSSPPSPGCYDGNNTAKGPDLSSKYLSRYEDHVMREQTTDTNNTIILNRKTIHHKRSSKRPPRRKLIASVTVENRICYEKI